MGLDAIAADAAAFDQCLAWPPSVGVFSVEQSILNGLERSSRWATGLTGGPVSGLEETSGAGWRTLCRKLHRIGFPDAPAWRRSIVKVRRAGWTLRWEATPNDARLPLARSRKLRAAREP